MRLGLISLFVCFLLLANVSFSVEHDELPTPTPTPTHTPTPAGTPTPTATPTTNPLPPPIPGELPTRPPGGTNGTGGAGTGPGPGHTGGNSGGSPGGSGGQQPSGQASEPTNLQDCTCKCIGKSGGGCKRQDKWEGETTRKARDSAQCSRFKDEGCIDFNKKDGRSAPSNLTGKLEDCQLGSTPGGASNNGSGSGSGSGTGGGSSSGSGSNGK